MILWSSHVRMDTENVKNTKLRWREVSSFWFYPFREQDNVSYVEWFVLYVLTSIHAVNNGRNVKSQIAVCSEAQKPVYTSGYMLGERDLPAELWLVVNQLPGGGSTIRKAHSKTIVKHNTQHHALVSHDDRIRAGPHSATDRPLPRDDDACHILQQGSAISDFGRGLHW